MDRRARAGQFLGRRTFTYRAARDFPDTHALRRYPGIAGPGFSAWSGAPELHVVHVG